jgi:hypothetical protein
MEIKFILVSLIIYDLTAEMDIENVNQNQVSAKRWMKDYKSDK